MAFREKAAVVALGLCASTQALAQTGPQAGVQTGSTPPPTTRSILIGTRERARDELFLATARDPALERFGRQLRYLRGRTGRGVLQAMLGEERPVTVSEGALFSAFSSSLMRTHALAPQTRSEATVRAEFESLFALIRQACPLTLADKAPMRALTAAAPPPPALPARGLSGAWCGPCANARRTPRSAPLPHTASHGATLRYICD
ncbi:hypothetical protein MTR62_18255 [Novosphingobium sp. 1949]|uniref:Uncharacterized protein n=1 Tax=Novosphingobium organovorum TaxID=2930092 RepID=A0ABT0BHS1_9SPHN|nr:hypothetical protein [Novosphingobium organovorum]MCJ2184615.1 hypothetical protein [Novosphingobium organovorum]